MSREEKRVRTDNGGVFEDVVGAHGARREKSRQEIDRTGA